MGFGCPIDRPIDSSFECWRADKIRAGAKKLDMQECTGTLLTDIGNNKQQAVCVGFPSGNYAIDYNGFKVPLGGWHRESVFDRAKFVAATTPNSTNTTEKRP